MINSIFVTLFLVTSTPTTSLDAFETKTTVCTQNSCTARHHFIRYRCSSQNTCEFVQEKIVDVISKAKYTEVSKVFKALRGRNDPLIEETFENWTFWMIVVFMAKEHTKNIAKSCENREAFIIALLESYREKSPEKVGAFVELIKEAGVFLYQGFPEYNCYDK